LLFADFVSQTQSNNDEDYNSNKNNWEQNIHNVSRLFRKGNSTHFTQQIYKKLPNGKLPKGNFYYSLTL
jgi:hypothetical protein